MNKNISVCGIDCSVACEECNKMHEELKSNPCKGCNAMEGKIFWAKYMNLDTCPIYTCVKGMKLEHCGKCEKLPCDIWINTKVPSFSDEQHQQSIKDRISVLKTL